MSEDIEVSNEEHKCFICKGIIQGSPQTWRQYYKNGILVGFIHKKCSNGNGCVST